MYDCSDENHLGNTFPSTLSALQLDPGWKNFLSVDRSDLDSTIRAEKETRNIYIYMCVCKSIEGSTAHVAGRQCCSSYPSVTTDPLTSSF